MIQGKSLQYRSRHLFRLWTVTALWLLAGSVTVSYSTHAQNSYVWTELPDAPFVNRYNDVAFVDETTGWVVHGDGEVFQTVDGGDTWSLQYRNLNAHFRSVAFLDAQHGFAGNVGPGEFGAVEQTPIFETVNGGQIWLPASGFADGPPTGICGMQAVNDSTIVAVGRVRGPAVFVRSIDSGQTWSTVDMSDHAAGLIDVFFTHPDSGLAVGLSNETHSESSAVVVRTTDGGQNWEEIFTSSRTGEWAWKMTFPSRQTGYVSLQRNVEEPIYFLKTVDGGSTWEEKLLFDGRYFVQGMGFVDENTGWVGGNSGQAVLVTTDGGDTWSDDAVRPRINRIRFVNDSLGYAVGRSVYKIQKSVPTGIKRTPIDDENRKIAVYPNPFSQSVTFDLGRGDYSDLRIVDVSGRTIRRFANEGSMLVEWDGHSDTGDPVSSGVYFVVARLGDTIASRPLIRVTEERFK
ncbi:MAG: T9SS type A sorting domain-containing protein [Rhodothermales bacterium]|nr:T9SS type A sorting domain-containing protein [Rhodothermales bacterium]